MPNILAWIAPTTDGRFIASWTSSETPKRPPAAHIFKSEAAARAWVAYEAAQLGDPEVVWLEPAR